MRGLTGSVGGNHFFVRRRKIMFKVLLVDDEIYVRKGLLELIPWETLKFNIVGEANNGAEADPAKNVGLYVYTFCNLGLRV